ncbi:unnamed protein product [Calypogeia fissa]
MADPFSIGAAAAGFSAAVALRPLSCTAALQLVVAVVLSIPSLRTKLILPPTAPMLEAAPALEKSVATSLAVLTFLQEGEEFLLQQAVGIDTCIVGVEWPETKGEREMAELVLHHSRIGQSPGMQIAFAFCRTSLDLIAFPHGPSFPYPASK